MSADEKVRTYAEALRDVNADYVRAAKVRASARSRIAEERDARWRAIEDKARRERDANDAVYEAALKDIEAEYEVSKWAACMAAFQIQRSAKKNEGGL